MEEEKKDVEQIVQEKKILKRFLDFMKNPINAATFILAVVAIVLVFIWMAAHLMLGGRWFFEKEVQKQEIQKESEEKTIVKGALKLTSDAFENGGMLPKEYTCDGKGISPAVTWSGVPTGTRELEILLSKDNADGSKQWNWIVYHIPTSINVLPIANYGVGLFGAGTGKGALLKYQAPCPRGTEEEKYTFTIYALSDYAKLPQEQNKVTANLLLETIKPLVLETASLSFKYSRTGK